MDHNSLYFFSVGALLLVISLSTLLVESEGYKPRSLRLLRLCCMVMALGWFFSYDLTNPLVFALTTIMATMDIPYLMVYPFLRARAEVPKYALLAVFIYGAAGYFWIAYGDLPMKYFYLHSFVYLTAGFGYSLYHFNRFDHANLRTHQALQIVYVAVIAVLALRALAHLFDDATVTSYDVVYDYIWGPVYIAYGLLILLSYLEQSLAKERERALKDDLTLLMNRRGFREALSNHFGDHAQGNPAFTLMIFDIDNFKSINDSNGHDVGDDVLRSLSTLFHMVLPETSYVGRLGGEEFVVALPGHSQKEGQALAERLVGLAARVPVIVECQEKVIYYTISGGVTYCQDIAFVSDSLREADQLLYKAKEKGKNQVVVSA